jgi:HK97 family phage major capsid protein
MKKDFDIRSALNKPLKRFVTIDKVLPRTGERAEGEEDYDIEFSYSSEFAADRWFGKEILDHDAKSVRMERANAGAIPMCFNHDPDKHVGAIVRMWIGDDRRGHVRAKFAENAFAQEKKRDMLNGTLRNVSFLYRMYDLILEKDKDGEDPEYRCLDWEPFEIGPVTIPVDYNVGQGRSAGADEERNNEILALFEGMTDAEIRAAIKSARAAPDTTTAQPATTKENDVKDTPAPAGATADEVRNQVTTEVRDSIEKLIAIADDNGFPDLGREAIKGKWDEKRLLAEVNKRLREGHKPVVTAPDTNAGLNEEEKRSYSLFAAIRSKFLKEGDGGLAREIHNDLAKRLGKPDWNDSKGILVPREIQNLIAGARTQSTSEISTGGALVKKEYGTMEDMLRHETLIGQLGVGIMGGLEGDFEKFRKTQNSTVYWLNENEGPTKSTMNYGLLKANPHTLGAKLHFTRRQLMQSSIDVEQDGYKDMADGISIEVDRVFFLGNGVDEPLGILNLNGTSSVSAATIVRANLLDHEKNVRTNKVPQQQQRQFVVSTNVKRFLRALAEDAGSGKFAWADNNTVIGYKAWDHTNLGDGYAIFGAFMYSQLLNWGVMEIDRDPYTDHGAGGVYLRALMDMDTLHNQAAAYSIQSSITA